jgi:hypothetical protein
MVFAHAPLILPAVPGLPFAYRPMFYVHVGVLHLSLVLRVVGDLLDSLGRWRVWGGLLKRGCPPAVHVQHGSFNGLERKSWRLHLMKCLLPVPLARF